MPASPGKKVLVLGGYGLIGEAVVGRLVRDGHQVTGLGRDISDAKRRWPAVGWIAADMSKLLAAEDWLPIVAGMDAVVNAAGALQDGPRDRLDAIHRSSVVALVAACEQAGGRRPAKTRRCPLRRSACFASGLLAVFQLLARCLRSSG